MYKYSVREYGQMLMCYGEARGNASRALSIYCSRFPNAQHPSDPRLITAAYQRILDNQPITPIRCGGRIQADVRKEERVLQLFNQNPRLGLRTASRILRSSGISITFTTVHKILKKHKRRPYKIHKVQALLPTDMERRTQFCRWLLSQQNALRFVKNVLWTDESTFTRNGMWNRRNSHIWSDTNPHAVQETGHQIRWSVNVWAGIHQGKIFGPVYLPQRMDGASYLELLQGPVTDLLDEVPLAQLGHMWFQHDGAPPHVVRVVRDHLNQEFPSRWIGRFGTCIWPPRSPDLTPLDFFLWGHVKERVFSRQCDTSDEMKTRISAVFEQLNEKSIEDPSFLVRVHKETIRRTRICLERGGSQFEPHLIRSRLDEN